MKFLSRNDHCRRRNARQLFGFLHARIVSTRPFVLTAACLRIHLMSVGRDKSTSVLGHSQPGRTGSKSGHVRYAAASGSKFRALVALRPGIAARCKLGEVEIRASEFRVRRTIRESECVETPPPVALFERADLPRKRERCTEPSSSNKTLARCLGKRQCAPSPACGGGLGWGCLRRLSCWGSCWTEYVDSRSRSRASAEDVLLSTVPALLWPH